MGRFVSFPVPPSFSPSRHFFPHGSTKNGPSPIRGNLDFLSLFSTGPRTPRFRLIKSVYGRDWTKEGISGGSVGLFDPLIYERSLAECKFRDREPRKKLARMEISWIRLIIRQSCFLCVVLFFVNLFFLFFRIFLESLAIYD